MSSVEFKLDDNSNANRTQLVEKIVNEVKSRGIFDQFRRECLTEIDRRPAFQLLQQKVVSNVNHFLDELKWRPDLNKNQLRETLRQNIIRSNFFDNGIEKLVNQVVDTKVEELFRPKIDELIKKLFGIEDKPDVSDESIKIMNTDQDNSNLPESILEDQLENEEELEMIIPEREPEPLPPGEEEDYFVKPAETNIEISEQIDNFEEETVLDDINENSESIEIPDNLEPAIVSDTNSDKNDTVFNQLIESNLSLQSHTLPNEDLLKSKEEVVTNETPIEPQIDEKIPEVESNEQNVKIDSEITEDILKDTVDINITDIDACNTIIDKEKILENKIEDKKVEIVEPNEKTDKSSSNSSHHRHRHSSSKSSKSESSRHHHYHHNSSSSSSKSSSGHHHSRHSHSHHSSTISRSKHDAVSKHNKRSRSSSSSTCSSTNQNKKRHHNDHYHHSHHRHRDHKHDNQKYHNKSDKKSDNEPKVESSKQDVTVSSKSSKHDEELTSVNNTLVTIENTINNDKKAESIISINKEMSNAEKEKQLKKEEIIKQMKEKLERSKEKIKLEMERENSRKLDEKQKKMTEKQERKEKKVREKDKEKVQKKKRERVDVRAKKSTKLLAMPAYIDTMAVEKELEKVPIPPPTPKVQRIRKPNMKYCSDEFTSEYYLPHEQNEKILNDINLMKRKREFDSQELTIKRKSMKEKLQLQMPIPQLQPINTPDDDIGEAIEDIAAAVAEVTANRQYNNNNPPQLLYSTNAISYNMFPQGPNTMFHNQQHPSTTQLLPPQQITRMPMLNMPQQQSITMITVPSSLPPPINHHFAQSQPQQIAMQQFHQQPTIIPFTAMQPHCMPQMILSPANMAPMMQSMSQPQPILLTHQQQQQQQQQQHFQQQMPLTHDFSSMIQQDLPHDLQSVIPQELPLMGMHEVSSLIEEELSTRVQEQPQKQPQPRNELINTSIATQEESMLDFNNVEPENNSDLQKEEFLNEEKPIDTIIGSVIEEDQRISEDDESLQSLRDSLKKSKSPSQLFQEEEPELESEPVISAKKKRGRKRKIPLVENDNEQEPNLELPVVRKSKRGRKKKIIAIIDLVNDDKTESKIEESESNEINSDDEPLESIRKSLKKHEKEENKIIEASETVNNDNENESGNIDDEGDGINKIEEENDDDLDCVLIEDNVVSERSSIGTKRSAKAQRYPTLNEEDIVSYVNYRPPRNKKIQRYTNDDLYKPRVSYSNTRSRSKSKKTFETINDNES